MVPSDSRWLPLSRPYLWITFDLEHSAKIKEWLQFCFNQARTNSTATAMQQNDHVTLLSHAAVLLYITFAQAKAHPADFLPHCRVTKSSTSLSTVDVLLKSYIPLECGINDIVGVISDNRVNVNEYLSQVLANI